MNPATIRLHEAIIRCLKGIIVAWQEWLQAVKTEQSAEERRQQKEKQKLDNHAEH